MCKNEKEAFLNMMELLSDYTKYMMMEKFLEGSALTAKSFTMDSPPLQARAVYKNLKQWEAAGIIKLVGRPGAGGSREYILDVDALVARLS
ncbi:MAG: hypothetical protein E7388_06000 [Ruminococcaceae bacterium]|nr:hypothetical protein [Oscillospiraceae bacterium]